MLLAGLDCLLKKFLETMNAMCFGVKGGGLCDTGWGTVKCLGKGSWEEDMGAVGILYCA